MSYKAKRIVIAVAAAAALFTAAATGTYFYIKGNESAEATENTEQVADQNIDSNTDTGSNNSESTSNDKSNGQTTGTQNRPVDNAGTPATNNGTTTTRTSTNDDGTTTRTTTNADGTTTTIRMNTDGTTTTTVTNPDGTIASQTTDANVVTEIEESERLVSKDDWVGWSPEAVPVPIMARIANDLGINKYKINVEKEVISTDANEDGKYDIDETITYKITVSNIGNTKLEGIKVSDRINDREDITKMSQVDENNTLIQEIENVSEFTLDLEAEETTYFEYSYTVKEEDILAGVVENSATAKNNKVEETTTTTTETEEVNEDYTVTKEADKTSNVKVGETVNYTITIKNEGNVTIKDIAVTDTLKKLDKNGNELSTMGLDVYEDKEYTTKVTEISELAVNETKTLYAKYEVTQADVDNQVKLSNIATAKDEPSDPAKTEVEGATPGYNIEKTATLEDTSKDKAEVGDSIKYIITVENTGNVTLHDIVITDTTMNKSTTVETLNVNSGKVVVIEFTHIIEESDFKKVDGNFVVQNIVVAECTDPTDDTKKLTDEAEAKVPVKDKYSYVVNYLEKDTNNVLANQKVVNDQTFGDKVTENAIDIDGYEKVEPTSAEIEITTGTNEHTFYYTKREDLSYTVNYLEKGTNTVLKDAKTVSNKTFGEVINSADEVIETINKDNKDYEYDSADKTTLTIGTGANIINLYYVKAKDLEVSKTAPATANVTDTITYTITITNPNSKAKKTTVIDTLPDGITIPNVDETTGKLPDGKGILTEEQIENEDGTTKTIRKITWTDLEVATGDTQITFNAIVDTDMIGKEITNTVSLSNYGSNQDDVTTKINEIKADKAEVKPGEQGKDSVNIILVMDLSNSMNGSLSETDSTTRLEAAKTAVQSFIDKIYVDKDGNPTNSKATITIVSFNKRKKSNWQPYSGTRILGEADKTNYQELKNIVSNISYYNTKYITQMGAALALTKTTVEDLEENKPTNKNVVIFLSDGEPYIEYDRTGTPLSDYVDNTPEAIIAAAKEIQDEPADFYSIGFGTEAGTEGSNAYNLLSQMSSDGTVYTSNSANGLIENFVNILDDIGIKEVETQQGNITMNPANGLLVSEEYPITVTYHDTEIIKITDISDLEDYSFSYDEATKTLTWDVNAWNASVTDENGRTEVTESKNAVIAYYTPRTTAKKLMRTSLPTSFLTDINEEKTLEEDEEIKLDKSDKEEEEVLIRDENKAEEEILLDKENNDEKENPVDVDANNEKQKEEPIVDDNKNGLQVVENEETNKEKDKDIIEDEEKDATVDENNIEETEISNVDSQLNVDTTLKDDCSLNIESNLQGNNQNNLTTLE